MSIHSLLSSDVARFCGADFLRNMATRNGAAQIVPSSETQFVCMRFRTDGAGLWRESAEMRRLPDVSCASELSAAGSAEIALSKRGGVWRRRNPLVHRKLHQHRVAPSIELEARADDSSAVGE